MTNNQKYHQACKKRFNAMLFDLYGCKSLIEVSVRFPICSAAQPGKTLRDFAEAWYAYKDGPTSPRST